MTSRKQKNTGDTIVSSLLLHTPVSCQHTRLAPAVHFERSELLRHCCSPCLFCPPTLPTCSGSKHLDLQIWTCNSACFYLLILMISLFDVLDPQYTLKNSPTVCHKTSLTGSKLGHMTSLRSRANFWQKYKRNLDQNMLSTWAKMADQ